MKHALAALAGLLVVYLACAFVAWEYDPSQWNFTGRFLLVLFGFPAAVMGFAASKGLP